MKTRHLAILLLTLVLILCVAPTIHADEPPDPPDHTDAIEPLPFDLGDELIEPRDGPVGALGEPPASPMAQFSTKWHIETVDGERHASDPSLALDGSGQPHISYSDDNDGLLYAWYDGENWHIEIVDGEGDPGYSSLALDGTGYPHISYTDWSTYDLKYAWYDGANWHIEIVDGKGIVGSPSLALDDAGYPHISYGHWGHYDLEYAWYDGANWHIEIVDGEELVSNPSLALDDAGYPHIGYTDLSNDDIKYARYDGMNWHIEIVDGEEHVSSPSLALDEAGYPHVSYTDWSNYDIKYAWYDGGNWHIEIVDGEEHVSSPSLALDGFGRPYIGYSDYANGDLKYARKCLSVDKRVIPSDSLNDVNALTHTLTYSVILFGPSWNSRLLDPLPDTVRYVTGSITTTLTPPAVYSPTLNAVIWEGTLLTGTAQTVRFQVTPQITSTRFLPAPLSITNTAWLTSEESGGSDTATATITILPPPFSLNMQTSIGGSRLYSHEPLTYTLILTGPGLNVSLWDPLPTAARYVAGSLTSTLTPPATYSPTARAIAWAGTLPADTAAVVRFRATANVGGVGDEVPSPVPLANTAWLTATESGRSTSATASVDVTVPPSAVDWYLEAVDSRGWVGGDKSLALDGASRPHIGYHDEWTGDLKYARHDGANWSIQTVDSTALGSNSSLALDGAGHPHISYRDSSNHDLKYAWHDGANWRIETVDSKAYGSDSSLALDGAGHPHISYSDWNYSELKYAWHDGANWHIETVDSESMLDGISLALDGAGRPHISYGHSYYDYDLKYAWHDGVNWRIETVDESIGSDSSLALDGAGHPHISYSAGRSKLDLNYAWHDGTAWYTETVDSEGRVGFGSSLALDAAGRPHISYYDSTNNALKYTWHDGTNWKVETVDSEGKVGWRTSLALDTAGRPHISYSNRYPNYEIKYARRQPFWLDKQGAPGDTLHDINALTHTLTYSLTLFGPGMNVRLQDPLPDGVQYVASSITSTLTPLAVYSPTLNTVVWAGTLPTDTTRTVRFQVTLDITSTRFLSAPLPIVNAAWMDDLDHEQRVLDTAVVTVPPAPLTLRKQAIPEDGVRTNDILTYTLTISGPGLSVRLQDPLPDGVQYVTDSLTSTLTPLAVYSPTCNTVIWAGTLPTGTSQVIRFQATPHVAGRGLAPVPITNTAWLTATESGRIISSTASVDVLPPRFYLGKRATPTDGLRNNGNLTYTLAISGVGLNLRLWDPLSPLVRYVSGSITDTFGTTSGTLALPAASYSPTAHAVVWQGVLPTGTLHTVQFRVTRGITGPGSLDLSLPVANTAWLTDTDSGWNISALAIVNGRYTYLPLVAK
jgi:uncharacterized repeat protein (TIGR01451 family)